MSYSKRIQIAVFLSLLLHIVGVIVLHFAPNPTPLSPAPLKPAPIEIDLQPEAPSPPPSPRQLVDVVTPTPESVPPSPLIAEENSEAMEETPQDGTAPSPELAPDDFDQLAARPVPSTKPRPIPTPPAEQEDKESTQEEERNGEPESEKDTKKTESKTKFEDMDTPLEKILTPKEKTPKTTPAEESIIKIAQVNLKLPQRPTRGRSRIQDGAAKQGTTNFQAIQSEIAPYMKKIRARVEREWNEMLYTRYSGTSPTKAVIDCAISPSGQLVSVSIVGTQSDRIYSLLCKDAVQRAGPFGPFPFVVPDIYLGKNLEIRWTFNFL